jgi:hypothetical protein
MELKIISGGQTGVDRGALDAALKAGIEHGGHCPKGRKAEDGAIPALYQLEETWTDKYPPRTAMNIRDADGTLILVHGRSGFHRSRGTKLTLEMCRKQKKPYLLANPAKLDQVEAVIIWLEELERKQQGVPGWLEELAEEDRPLVINVAGPRESMAPGIHDETVKFLGRVLVRVS